MSDLRERANARLDEWLREYDQRSVLDMLEEAGMRASEAQECPCKRCDECRPALMGSTESRTFWSYQYQGQLSDLIASVYDHPALFGEAS